ncbi:MAG TPA: PEP-CTERM sorting domain-containing protein, partial [Vicinamibacterales bacterium]|nr:PEP-CTERM sorting domain-containing protein [Vicinamibacterales bacterium]
TYDTMGAGTGLAGLDYDTALPPPTGPTGPFIQVTVATNYFAGIGMTVFQTTGSILNTTNNPVPPANYTFAPSGVTIDVPDFLQNFNNCLGLCNGLHFDLTEIPDQPGSPCTSAGPGVGNSCSEGPFIITQTVTGIRIDYDVLGTFVNGADSNTYIGSFGVTLNGLTFADLGNRLLNTGELVACGAGNNSQPCSFTANFNPYVLPEPATLLTFGLGSLGLARLRRRKKR